jgi:DNA-binding NarL/FixJ family response regulator
MQASTNPTILVAEDDQLLAATLRRILERAGYRVLPSTRTGGEVLAALERDKPDLVLLDVGLDGSDGIEVAYDVRKRSDVPIVFVSGRSDDATLRRVRGTNPAGYVVKPFSDPQIRAAVEIALQAPRSSRASEAERALARIAEIVGSGGWALHAPPGLANLPELATLSVREREVLELLVSHLRAPAIAQRLGISPLTVRNHLKAIFRKLGVSSQQELLDRVVARHG